MIDCVAVQHLGWDDLLDDMSHEVLLDLLLSDLVSVLGGYDHSMDTQRDTPAPHLLVLHRHLNRQHIYGDAYFKSKQYQHCS